MVHMLPHQDVPHQRSKTQITSHIWRSINTPGNTKSLDHWKVRLLLQVKQLLCWILWILENQRDWAFAATITPNSHSRASVQKLPMSKKPTHISFKSPVKTAFIILFQPQKQTIEQNHEVSVLIPFFSFFHFFFLKMQKLPHKARVACWKLNS